MKRKVLIPLDGSEFSRRIVPVVRSFFDPEGAELILLRVAQTPSASPDVSPQDVLVGSLPMAGSYEAYSRTLDAEFTETVKERESYRKALAEELRAEAERLRQHGYTVSVEVHFGDPAQRIIDFVNDEGIDLVAMATHGRTGIGRLVMGSVAERVLRGVKAPVLLMRTAEPSLRASPGQELAQSLGDGRQLSVVVATDGSTLAQRGLAVACELAQVLKAKLSVLVVVSERDTTEHRHQVMDQVCSRVEQFMARPEVVPLVGYPDEVILRYVAEHPTDLLFMGAFHDRGASSATAVGPTVQRLVQHAPTSVWVVKGHHPLLRRILACVALDDTVVIDVAAPLAQLVGAELTVLHVAPPATARPAGAEAGEAHETPFTVERALSEGAPLSAAVAGWVRQLERHGVERDALVLERGSAPEAILQMAREGSYDLVVVGSQSGPGYFLGSVANSVVMYAPQSVLVVRTRVQ